MAPLDSSAWAQRALTLVIAIGLVPAVLSIRGFLEDVPITAGEPAPRTVIAPDLIRVTDEEGTERSRREAAQSVTPVQTVDNEARQEITQSVVDLFAQVVDAREPGADGRVPTRDEQIESLDQRFDALDTEALRQLLSLEPQQFTNLRTETIGIAQQLARRGITTEEVAQVTDEVLQSELAIRALPEGTGETIVAPIIRDAARPTLSIDEEATQQNREEAAAAVVEREVSFTGGTPIVRAGEMVTPVEFAALSQRGLEGGEPWRITAKAFVLSLVILLAMSVYLRAYRTYVWKSSRQLLLLAVLELVFVLSVEAVMLLSVEVPWHYVVPVGAIAMLATILFDPPIGVLTAIPVTALVAFSAPGEAGTVAFAAIAGLSSVPLVSRLSARGHLRRAAWQSTLGYAALAAAFTGVFGEASDVGIALVAGFGNGVLTAMLVNSSLPFLESVFGVLTATSLLDLQDRNHPLLRELEQKALGSYNHSIEVSKMVESACRKIDADSLLASVAALYHDIGKVRRPYFFVENQFGIANPHDDLDPEVSARIIQEHVTDGIAMARSSRLPPEVVEGIRTHHGTTLVSFFYRQAVNAADDADDVDQADFRYSGQKPSTKEMAVLMLADCCEGATRAAALHDRNLTRDTLDNIVTGLISDRVEEGQLDEADLTFRELNMVQDSFIQSLVGTYHPRIPYPDLERRGDDGGRASDTDGQEERQDAPDEEAHDDRGDPNDRDDRDGQGGRDDGRDPVAGRRQEVDTPLQ
jgi:putative nucleotidyltransferase with HDIG domain